jgi:hypothetical protein
MDKEYGPLKNLRWGKAEVDVDADPKLVVLILNKPAPGMARRLKKTLKGTGFTKIEIRNEDGSVAEAVGEEEDEGAETEAQEAGQTPPAPPPPPQAAAQPDAGALARELAELIKRIGDLPANQAALRQPLVKLAGDANASIKAGNLADATGGMARLRDALDRAAGAATATTPTPASGPAATPKATPATDFLAVFRDAKDEVDAGLDKLAHALRQTGDVDMIRIADFGLNGLTDGQGVGLMKALFDLRAASPDRREAFAKAARDAAAAYKAAVFADKVVDLVDANPFGIEVGIRSKLGPALDTIAKAA